MKFHDNKRPFKCPHCPKRFVLRQNLADHVSRHLKTANSATKRSSHNVTPVSEACHVTNDCHVSNENKMAQNENGPRNLAREGLEVPEIIRMPLTNGQQMNFSAAQIDMQRIGDSFNQAGDNYTHTGDNLTQESVNFTQVSSSFTQAGDNLTQANDSFTPACNNFGQAGDNFTQPSDNFPQAGQNFTPAGDNFTQTGHQAAMSMSQMASNCVQASDQKQFADHPMSLLVNQDFVMATNPQPSYQGIFYGAQQSTLEVLGSESGQGISREVGMNLISGGQVEASLISDPSLVARSYVDDGFN